jgi:hypothetical protein
MASIKLSISGTRRAFSLAYFSLAQPDFLVIVNRGVVFIRGGYEKIDQVVDFQISQHKETIAGAVTYIL